MLLSVFRGEYLEGVPRHGHQPAFGRVLELPVAGTLAGQIPAVRLDQLDDLANRHAQVPREPNSPCSFQWWQKPTDSATAATYHVAPPGTAPSHGRSAVVVGAALPYSPAT